MKPPQWDFSVWRTMEHGNERNCRQTFLPRASTAPRFGQGAARREGAYRLCHCKQYRGFQLPSYVSNCLMPFCFLRYPLLPKNCPSRMCLVPIHRRIARPAMRGRLPTAGRSGDRKDQDAGQAHPLLLDEGIDPAAILVLTFSNRAAGELAERIAQRHPTRRPKSGSAHSTPSAST